MRSDLFQSRKCVHIKIPKEVHATLREKMFKHNLTMQELFSDYAETMAEDSMKAERTFERLVSKRIKAMLEDAKANRKKQIKGLMMGELDSNTLYSLLEEAEKTNNEKW